MISKHGTQKKEKTDTVVDVFERDRERSQCFVCPLCIAIKCCEAEFWKGAESTKKGEATR